MQAISIKPYELIQGKTFGKVRIDLKKADFEGMAFKEGRTVINFEECSFEELIIENSEDIEFPNISFHFIRCDIDRIEVENIITQNVSINFYHSLINGRISSDNIQAVECNNCLLCNSIFITGPAKVRITYSKENLDLGFFKATNKRQDALNGKQSYYLEKIKKAHVSSNFDLGSDLLNINVSITLTFDPNIEDEKTDINNIQLRALTLTGTVKVKSPLRTLM